MADIHTREKRYRIAFSIRQINYLEEIFKKHRYISINHRQELAATLNLPERAVKVWFQNRRMRSKRETLHQELKDEIVEIPKSPKLPILVKELGHNTHKSTFGAHELPRPICTKTNRDENVIKCSVSVTESFINLPSTSKNLIGNSSMSQSNLENNCTTTSCFKSPKLSTGIFRNYKREATFSQANLPNPVSVQEHQSTKRCVVSKIIKCRQQKIRENPSLNQKVICDSSVSSVTPEPNATSKDPRYIFVAPSISQQVRPYYPGGVLWNPLNVAQPVPPAPRVPISVYNPFQIPAAMRPPKVKKCCCDCHMPPATSSSQQQMPQYMMYTSIPSSKNN